MMSHNLHQKHWICTAIYKGSMNNSSNIPSRAKEGAEKAAIRRKGVPQGLKPRCKECIYGTAEAVPLSATEFFRSL
jgi:hypothetical protein